VKPIDEVEDERDDDDERDDGQHGEISVGSREKLAESVSYHLSGGLHYRPVRDMRRA
jgi:hypothetical protein